MLKDKRFQRVSMAALALGTWGIPAAYAQGSAQAPAVERVQPKVDDTETEDRVVVTGSNIAGAAESSALPVEVYTQEDNFKTGNQSTLEFIKSLSVVGSTVGETNQFQAGYGGIGSSSLNLRGLGGGRTLTIFNGRRFSENTNMIPSIALARTEILKDGGAVIYGADATGGVVNFITRDSFDGLIVDVVKRLGATAVSITHDMASARRIGDQAAMIHKGRIVWSGDAKALGNTGNAMVDQFARGEREGPIAMELRR